MKYETLRTLVAASMAFISVLAAAQGSAANQQTPAGGTNSRQTSAATSTRGTAEYGSNSGNSAPGVARAAASVAGAKDRDPAPRPATDNDTNDRASAYVDTTIVGSDGEELGHVRDFFIDPHTGSVRYAVVSSGGYTGVDDDLHLVPFEALKTPKTGVRDNYHSQLNVALNKQQWTDVPEVTDDAFKQGRFTFDALLKQRVARAFSVKAADPASESTLVRATTLRGRNVTSGGEQIGKIDGIVIHLGQDNAMALITPRTENASGTHAYVVPFAELQIATDGKGDVQTKLTRQDFPPPRNSNRTARTSNQTATHSPANVSSVRQSQNVAGDATSGTAAAGVVTAASNSPAARAQRPSGTNGNPGVGSSGTASSTRSSTTSTLSPTGYSSGHPQGR